MRHPRHRTDTQTHRRTDTNRDTQTETHGHHRYAGLLECERDDVVVEPVGRAHRVQVRLEHTRVVVAAQKTRGLHCRAGVSEQLVGLQCSEEGVLHAALLNVLCCSAGLAAWLDSVLCSWQPVLLIHGAVACTLKRCFLSSALSFSSPLISIGSHFPAFSFSLPSKSAKMATLSLYLFSLCST